MVSDEDDKTDTPEADGDVGLEDPAPEGDRSYEESEDDFDAFANTIDLPEPQWALPERLPGWQFELPPPAEQADDLKESLTRPGIVVLGLHEADQRIVPNWLHDLIDAPDGSPFETFCTLHFEEEDECVEGTLCAEIKRLYSERTSESKASTKRGMLAVVECRRFDASPSERSQHLKEFERQAITLVFVVNSAELGRVAQDNIATFDLDTLDVAFRVTVAALTKDERPEVLTPKLAEVYEALAEEPDFLASVRNNPRRRDDFRDEINRLLEAAKDGDMDVAGLVKDALKNVRAQGRDGKIDKMMMRAFGLENEAQGGELPDLDALAETQSVKEPYATAIFLLWACLGIRPDGVAEIEFRNIFKQHLRHLRAQEDYEIAEAIKRAKAKGKKTKKAVAKIETPATKLLENEALIDVVVDNVLAKKRMRQDGVTVIGYPNETQALLDGHLRKRPEYVDQQIHHLETWLNPIFASNAGIGDLGRFLFVYSASRRGAVRSEHSRDAVIDRLFSWIMQGYLPNREELDTWNQARQLKLRGEAALDESIVTFADHTENYAEKSFAERRKITRRKLVALIANWYVEDSQNSSEPLEDVTRDFSKLVTVLLQKLLQEGPNLAFQDFFKAFIGRRPEMVDVSAVMAIVGNNASHAHIADVLGILSDDADRSGRVGVQYAAYRYVVSELENERRLGDRKGMYQWLISALALRVLPACLQRLTQDDFEPGTTPDFSTDDMMSKILAEDRGIETFVDVLLNDRVRLYAKEIDSQEAALAEGLSQKAQEEVSLLIRRDLVVMAYHAMTLWMRSAKDIERETDDQDSEHDAGAEMRAEIRDLWRKANPPELVDDRRHAYADFGELLPYIVLQELHGMLLCSGRDALAARLLDQMRETMPSRDREKMRRVVRLKIDNLKLHRRELISLRKSLLRHKKETDEVDRWLSFAETRASVVTEFAI